MVLLSDAHDYFFVLYVVYFAAQGWLAVLALAHYPGEQDLDPLPENISLIVYEVHPSLLSSKTTVSSCMHNLCRSTEECAAGRTPALHLPVPMMTPLPGECLHACNPM